MKKLYLLLMLLTVWLPAWATGRIVLRLPDPGRATVMAYGDQGLDVAAYKPGEWLDLVGDQKLLSELRERGLDPMITQREDDIVNQSRTLDGYRSYEQMLTDLQYYAQNYPSICMLVDLGPALAAQYAAQGYHNYDDFANYHVWAIKISDDPQEQEDEPEIYFMGGHHAREPLGCEVVMGIIDDLLNNYDSDPETMRFIDERQIWLVPMVNPDGHKIVCDETDVWWRKNLRDNNGNCTFDTYNTQGYGRDGVDLNRNYGLTWGNVQASDDYNDPTYHGTEAFSEPETAAMRDLLGSHNFVEGISYHTYSGLVLYPWGHASGIYAPDNDAMADLATEMAGNLPLGQSYYTPEISWTLYPASGGLDDYAYATKGTFAYTIEMGNEFIPAGSQVPGIVSDQVNNARYFINRTFNKGLTGHVTDAATGLPLAAKVQIADVDGSHNVMMKSDYTSEGTFGRFTRLLMPGTYQVTFNAWGYLPQTRQVNVSEAGLTSLDVSLTPSVQINWRARVVDRDNLLPISNARVLVLNADPEVEYTSNSNGDITIAELFTGHQQLQVVAAGYPVTAFNVDVQSQTPGQVVQLQLSSGELVDDFENGLANWMFDLDWATVAGNAHSGSYCLTDSPNGDYANNTTTYCKLRSSLNIAQAETVQLYYWAKWSLEAGYDFAYFQISADNGDIWQNLGSFTGDSNGWQELTYDLTGYQSVTDNLLMRFYVLTDDYTTSDGLYIDDIRLCKPSTQIVAAGDQNAMVTACRAYPNLFNPNTTINFSMTNAGMVNAAVYNIRGQKVKTLCRKNLSAGTHELHWDGGNDNGSSLASGVYFCRLTVGAKEQVLKLVLIK